MKNLMSWKVFKVDEAILLQEQWNTYQAASVLTTLNTENRIESAEF